MSMSVQEVLMVVSTPAPTQLGRTHAGVELGTA